MTYDVVVVGSGPGGAVTVYPRAACEAWVKSVTVYPQSPVLRASPFAHTSLGAPVEASLAAASPFTHSCSRNGNGEAVTVVAGYVTVYPRGGGRDHGHRAVTVMDG